MKGISEGELNPTMHKAGKCSCKIGESAVMVYAKIKMTTTDIFFPAGTPECGRASKFWRVFHAESSPEISSIHNRDSLSPGRLRDEL
jgi:hypothetical protein